jgi:hypothetical protein
MNGGADIADAISDLVDWLNGDTLRSITLQGHCAGLRVTATHRERVLTFSTDSPGRAFKQVAKSLADVDGKLVTRYLRIEIANLEVAIDGEQRSLDAYRERLAQFKRELDGKFLERAKALLAPHVTEIGSVRRGTDQSGHETVELQVKTHRIPADSEDCDALGTDYPSDEAHAAADKLAEEFGRTCSGFQPTEKGWGFYEFGRWQSSR